MAAVDLAHIEAQNADAYDDLIVTVSASEGVLSLFLAVCDDAAFREEIIQRYEAELAPDIPAYRAMISKEEPSLRQAVAAVVEREPQLQAGERGVITVLGADSLLPLILGEEERSQQSQFLGYLQWTRESLREFKYPVILWVTSRLLAAVGREAPDFWGWRKDVFRFQALAKAVPVNGASLEPWGEKRSSSERDDDELPIEELLKLVEEREQQPDAKDDPLLATLYFHLGKAYERQSERQGSATYKSSVAEAIAWYHKAIQLQTCQNREQTALAMTLNNLAELYRAQGKYKQAEPLYLQAIEMRRRTLGEDHPGVATTLNNLALLYYAQGKYEQAEPLYLQALEIRRRVLGEDHPYVAQTLNNLAALCRVQGKYEQAEPLYLQALEMRRRALGKDHPYVAQTLNNLALLYRAQGKYEQAEPLYLQARSIYRKALGEDHPEVATTLNNLARLHYAQGKYEQAEPLYLQALEMRRRALGEDHPYVAMTLNNLAGLYEAQGKYDQAESFYLQSLDIKNKRLGKEHSSTKLGNDNFRYMVEQAHQANLADTLSDRPLTQSILQQIRDNEI